MAKQRDKVEVKRSQEIEKKAAARAARSLSDPLLGLRQDIDRVFDSYFRGWPGLRDFGVGFPSGLAAIDLSPDVDIAETEKAYKIAVELPGLDDKDIEVSLSDDLLTVSGEKKTEREESKKDYYLSERRYGSFKRSFRLPAEIEAGKITAEMDKGVLSITLPKSASAKRKQHKIEIAAKKK